MFLYLRSLFVKNLVKSKILVYNIWWFAIEIKTYKAQQAGEIYNYRELPFCRSFSCNGKTDSVASLKLAEEFLKGTL